MQLRVLYLTPSDIAWIKRIPPLSSSHQPKTFSTFPLHISLSLVSDREGLYGWHPGGEG